MHGVDRRGKGENGKDGWKERESEMGEKGRGGKVEVRWEREWEREERKKEDGKRYW